MTGRTDFTQEEWELVLEGPPSAGMIVVTAQRGGTFRESIAMAKAYVEARRELARASYWTKSSRRSPSATTRATTRSRSSSSTCRRTRGLVAVRRASQGDDRVRIMGLAFAAVVNSLVNNLVMPIVAAIIGKPDFRDLTFTIHRSVFRLEPSMLLFLYIAVRLAAFVMIFVCLGLALRRARSYERVSSFPLFLWAVVFVPLSAFLAVL
jgi:hypothetical protein